MSAVTIDTERARLRPFTAKDADALARLYCDPDVMKFLPGYPQGFDACRGRALADIERYNAHWQQRGYGVWAVEDRNERRLVGRCGLRWLPEFDAVELLYMLDRTHWRRGLASELARRTVSFGMLERRLPRLIGIIKPENIGSGRVLEKAGFAYERHAPFRDFTVALYRRDKPPAP